MRNRSPQPPSAGLPKCWKKRHCGGATAS